MIDIIQDLRTYIAHLTEPVDFFALYQKLNNTPLDQNNCPPELIEQLELINFLFNLLKQHSKLSEVLAGRQALFAQSENTQNQLTNEMEQLTTLAKQKQVELLELYDVIKANSKHQAFENTSLSSYKQIDAYHQYINKSLFEINDAHIKSSYVLLQAKSNDLYSQLNDEGINLSLAGPKQLKSMLSKYHADISVLEELVAQINHLQTELVQQLNPRALEPKIELLKTQTREIGQEQAANSARIIRHALPQEQRALLMRAFHDAADKQALIATYRDEISTLASYLNPFNLIAMASGNDYQNRQAELPNIVDFLELLVVQLNLSTQNVTYQNELNHLLNLSTQNQHQDASADNATLLEQTAQLFCALAKQLSIEIKVDALIYESYAALLHYLPMTVATLEEKQKHTGLLRDLISTNETLTEIMSQHEIPERIEDLPNIEAAKQVTATPLADNPELPHLIEQQKLCAEYIKVSKQLHTVQQELNLSKAHKTIFTSQHNQTRDQLEISNAERELAEATAQIKILIKTIKALPNPADLLAKPIDVPPQTEPVIDVPIPTTDKQETNAAPDNPGPLTIEKPSTPIVVPIEVIPSEMPKTPIPPKQKPLEVETEPKKSAINKDKLIQLHESIMERFAVLPQDIQVWYTQISYEIQKSLTKESASWHLKVVQALHDILFELRLKDNYKIIRAYIQLCPNPKQGLKPLLDLKPALPLDDSLNIGLEEQQYSQELKPYYTQYTKLKTNHPLEAELFLHALRSVHAVQEIAKHSKSDLHLDLVASLTTDPRYEPLKRHRGFLKLWEMLEDFCRSIAGLFTSKSQDQNIPCRFFKPNSTKLLDDAENMVRQLVT